MLRKWIVPTHDIAAVQRLCRALRVSPLTARVLINRGMSEPPAAARFLKPTLHELKDPCEDESVRSAAAFLTEAAKTGKHITVFGDYDADGICATALLVRCLKLIGGKVDFYIPDRQDEGYGLSCAAVQQLADRGTEVIVTVDCGVKSTEEADFARRLGMELLITDHHEPGPARPDVRFLLNPKLDDCKFGFGELCGAGVAFKLMWAIGQEASAAQKVSDEYKDFLLEALSLVAIATIADVVPVLGENRVLAHYGLRTLPHTAMPGLRALQSIAKLRKGTLSAYDIAFKLAPRLNAAGRMGDAQVAVDLLTTDDERHAADLAEYLEAQNTRRRAVQKALLKEAEGLVEEKINLEGRSCIVLWGQGWHQGVVGLVASRLAEKFWRPTFVFAVEDGVATGSARSIPGFPLLRAVEQCRDMLDRYGGHEGAAGLTLPLERLEEFTERIDEVVGQSLGGELPVPHLQVEGEVALGELNPAVVSEIEALAPFGEGNPPPLFVADGLSLVGNPQLVGRGSEHLSFLVRQGDVTVRAIAFGKAGWLGEVKKRSSERFALVFQPRPDTYSAYNAIVLRVEDMQWESERLVEQRGTCGVA